MIFYVIKQALFFFLDYFACSSVIPSQYTKILKSITNACKKINCALIGGETAEMPSLYKKNHFDMAGFCVGLKEKTNNFKVKKNDLIIGIKSNGFHSNGFSLIRKIIRDNKINLKRTNIKNKNLAEIIMRPTRLYHQFISKNDFNYIKTLSHITGGGIVSNFTRSISSKIKFELDEIKLPYEYDFIQDNLNTNKKELMEVFNCGIGMILVIDKKYYKKFYNRKLFSVIGQIQ